jgi:hypothetical protein
MDYRIPMNRLEVRLRLSDGTEKRADIFLHTASESHSGPETVDEFLNSARAFIPCLLTETSDPFLCNKETIVSMAGVEDGAYILREEGTSPTAIHRVRITLSGGVLIEGDLHVFLPTENCRVSDFLNSTESFFPLRVADGRVTYVHRRYVDQVVPLLENRPS